MQRADLHDALDELVPSHDRPRLGVSMDARGVVVQDPPVLLFVSRVSRLIVSALVAGVFALGGAACVGDDVEPGSAAPASDAADDAPSTSSGSTNIDGGADVAAVGSSHGCRTSAAGAMVLAKLANGVPFCIDATEVTSAAYEAFVAATGPNGFGSAGPPPSCVGYSGFERKGGAPLIADQPVDYVTWCDAFAFCRSAGKRLCGQIAGTDATTGEWYAACSAGGKRVYSYGNTYDPNACNTMSDATKRVGSSTGCEGGLPGLVDMNGNAGEWVDACDPVTSQCSYAGGFYASGSDSTCDGLFGNNPAASQPYPGIGFRCCANPE
jgi:formylglycine-generating enzyme